MTRAAVLPLLGALAVAGCGGGGDERPAPPRAAAAPPSAAARIGTAPRRAETPLAIVCLREARLANPRQSQPGVWRAIAANGQFVVVQLRRGHYRVRGGVAEESAGRAVDTVAACLGSSA